MTGKKSRPYDRACSRICFFAARSSSGNGARVWEAIVQTLSVIYNSGVFGHDDRLPVIGLIAVFLSIFLPMLRNAVRDFPQLSLWIVLPASVIASLVLVVVVICA